MEIEVERGIEIQKGRPRSVAVKMIDNEGNVKAVVTVAPEFTDKKDDDTFRVEVWTGFTPLNKPVDIKLKL